MHYTNKTPCQQAVDLLLIQQRYRLCGVQEEHRVAFEPMKNPSNNAIDIARECAVEYAQGASRRVAKAP